MFLFVFALEKTVNNCSFSGRLVRDPEAVALNSGKKLTKFTLVIDRKFKNPAGEWDNDPSFLDFEAWDFQAELVVERYAKGDYMLVADASIKTDRWDDKTTGEKREKLRFVANRIELLPLLNSPNGAPGAEPAATATPKKTRSKKASETATPSREEEPAMADGVGDDDIPF